MSEVKVSIVVPIYNLEKYIPRCLDALVNQTLEEIEILCVDDGSKEMKRKKLNEKRRIVEHIFLKASLMLSDTCLVSEMLCTRE